MTRQNEISCQFEGCGRMRRWSGLCKSHAEIRRRHPDKPLRALLPTHRLKGTGSLTQDGYKTIVKDGRKAYEHQWVMEYTLGRQLQPGENVHHINGDRLDNRPENLELWSTRQPSGQRVRDKTAWAKEWLRLYEPEALACVNTT